MNNQTFYFLDGIQPVGPVPFAELKAAYSSGIINEQTQVCIVGENQWQPLICQPYYQDIAAKPFLTAVPPPFMPQEEYAEDVSSGPNMKKVLIGLGMIVAGVGLTVMTYLDADSSSGTYTVFYGLPIAGIYYLFKGFSGE